MSKPSAEAIAASRGVMDRLRKEIPTFHLGELLMTIRDDYHETTMTWEAFIVTRYAEAIQEQLDKTSFFREKL